MRTAWREKVLLLTVIVGSTLCEGLVMYELSAKSSRLPGGPWPGWREATLADRLTPWSPHTHIAPLDRLLHEGKEACLYYRAMLGDLRPGPPAASFDIYE